MVSAFAAALLALMAVALPAAFAGYTNPEAPAGEAHVDFEPGLDAIRSREFALAVEHLARVVQGEPDNADAHHWLGVAYRELGRRDDALRAIRRALAIDSAHRGARANLGLMHIAAGDLPGARAELAALARLCPQGCEESRALAAAITRAR